MVCSEVEALAMGLCASYATFGEARGLLGVEDVPWSQARQVHVSRGTRSLIERALSSPGEGPRFLGARGTVRIETRETSRLIGVGEPGFSHQSGSGFGRLRPMQGKVDCLAQKCFLPEVAEGTQE